MYKHKYYTFYDQRNFYLDIKNYIKSLKLFIYFRKTILVILRNVLFNIKI